MSQHLKGHTEFSDVHANRGHSLSTSLINRPIHQQLLLESIILLKDIKKWFSNPINPSAFIYIYLSLISQNLQVEMK